MSLKKQIKKTLIPAACKIFLAPKSFSQPPENIKKYYCSKENAIMMSDTSNNVVRFAAEGETFYFREIKIRKDIKDYVIDEIDFYYGNLHPELTEDKEIILSSLSDKQNLDKFVNMGMTNDITSGAYQFCAGNSGSHIGLDALTAEQEERIRAFVQYVWGNLFAYKLNNGVAIGKYQTYNSVRSIAFSRVARLIGLRHMIPETEYAFLRVDDEAPFFGTVMRNAPGICMEKSDNADRIRVCSPELQRELNNLNLLDVLCFEKDHRPGNYNVLIKNGKVLSVCAFDNDSPNSFGIGGVSFKTYIGCSPYIIDGKINRPYVDRALAEAVINLNEKELDNALKDLLNYCQLCVLKHRLKLLKKALLSMPEEMMLSTEQWRDDTVKKELSGDYGDTYLVKFLQEQKIMHQPWIKKSGNPSRI